MWLSQLTTYELEFAHPDDWEAGLAAYPVKNPEFGQRKCVGFLPMEKGSYVDHVANHYAILGAVAERHLPKDAVDREVRQRGLLSEGDENSNRKAWAEVEQEMLSTAPVRERPVLAVYDDYTKRLYVFASAKLAEDVILHGLREALGSVHAVPVAFKQAVEPQLTTWLTDGKAPEPFLLGRHVELESTEDTGGKTVFKEQDLSGAAVKQQMEDGAVVSLLQLNWGGRLEFKINTKGEIRQVGPPDCELKPQFAHNYWADIMEDLPKFFADVMRVMGGEANLGSEVVVEERVKPSQQATDNVDPGGAEGERVHAPADAERSSSSQAGPVEASTGSQAADVQDGQGVRIAIVAFGDKTDATVLLPKLDRLRNMRPISEVLIPDISNDVMRMSYRWAAGHSIKIKVVHKRERSEEDRMADVFDHQPNGIVMFGGSEEGDAYQEMARKKAVKVMRL